jgi:hypothetical protein
MRVAASLVVAAGCGGATGEGYEDRRVVDVLAGLDVVIPGVGEGQGRADMVAAFTA